MSRPNAEEFRQVLLSRSPEAVAKEYIFSGEVYAFKGLPDAPWLLTQHLCRTLDLGALDFTVVGSGRTGFSLDPDKFPAEFSETSDIDVLVVNHTLFDAVWNNIVEWSYRVGGAMRSERDNQWLGARRRELHKGYFEPNNLRNPGVSGADSLAELRDFSTRWFDAFQSLSWHPEFAARRVSGRLYRTWDFAMLYQADNLRRIAEQLRK